MATYIRKTSHDLSKRKLTSKDVGVLAYYDLLYGRSNNVTDWQEEVNNRCPATISIKTPAHLKVSDDGSVKWHLDAELLHGRPSKDHDFENAMRAELKKIVAQLIPARKQVKETFKVFYKRRHEWMSSGASGGFKVQLSNEADEMESQDKTVRAGKRTWAEATSFGEILNFMRSKRPVEFAKGSDKFENGKSRAIYGVEPFHYVINTYATKGLEERMNQVNGFEKGSSSIMGLAQEGYRTTLSGLGDMHCTMLDFADFNRHHTPTMQAMVFECLAERGRELGAVNDWIEANEWVARSKFAMSAEFPGFGTRKVVQGMFSGTRSTDLINTMLNMAYFEVANAYIRTEYDIQPVDLYHVHQGDDIWISNTNKLWPRLVYYTMNQQGFLFQPSKQMFGQQRGEYLRVLYQEHEARGYLGRAIANYITRPIQNDVQMGFKSWAATISSSVAVLARRGLNVFACALLWHDNMTYHVKVSAAGKDLKPVGIPMSVIMNPVLCNGLGHTPPYTQLAFRLDGLPQIPSEELPNIKFLSGLPNKMADDWIESVSSKGSGPVRTIRAEAVKNALLRDNYADVISELKTNTTAKKYKETMAKYATEVSTKVARAISEDDMLASFSNGPDEVVEIPKVIYLNKKSVRQQCNMQQVGADTNTSKPIVLSDPHLVANMRYLVMTSEPPKQMRSYNQTQESLSRLITSSRFKSLNITTLALGVSQADALSAIVEDRSDASSIDSNVGQVLNHIKMNPQSKVIELINSNRIPLLTPYSYSKNMGLVDYLSASTSSSLLQSLANKNIVDLSQLQHRLDAYAYNMLYNASTTPAWSLAVLY